MLEKLIIVVHLLTALSVIGLILLQQGKGADMGASFGSGASQTVFGAGGGGNVLTRATAILAAIFFATSLGLSIYAKQHANAVTDPDIPVADVAPVAEKQPEGDVPAAPAQATAEAGDVPVEAVAPGEQQGAAADVPAGPAPESAPAASESGK